MGWCGGSPAKCVPARYHAARMKPLRLAAALLQRLVDKIDPHEGRYRMLFERSPLPMWVVDTTTLHFLAVNDAALRSEERRVGKGCRGRRGERRGRQARGRK